MASGPPTGSAARTDPPTTRRCAHRIKRRFAHGITCRFAHSIRSGRNLVSTSSATLSTALFPAPVRSARRGISLALVLGAQLMIILDLTVVNIALPHIQHGLGFSAAGLSWGAHRLFADLRRPAAARRAARRHPRAAEDVHGGPGPLHNSRRWLAGLATSAAMLLAARALQGVGGASASPCRARADRLQLPRGPGTDPGARHLHRRRNGRRLARPGPRRHDHRVGVLAVGPVHQRADRRRGDPGRPAGSCRRPSASRACFSTWPAALTSTAGMSALVYAFNPRRRQRLGWIRLTLAAFAVPRPRRC